jgi:hypothetical protein
MLFREPAVLVLFVCLQHRVGFSKHVLSCLSVNSKCRCCNRWETCPGKLNSTIVTCCWGWAPMSMFGLPMLGWVRRILLGTLFETVYCVWKGIDVINIDCPQSDIFNTCVNFSIWGFISDMFESCLHFQMSGPKSHAFLNCYHLSTLNLLHCM